MGRFAASLEYYLQREHAKSRKWSSVYDIQGRRKEVQGVSELQKQSQRFISQLMPVSLIHFFLGLATSFAGSLPPGVISITVIDSAVRKSFRSSLMVAGAASFVEFFQSFIA